MRFFIWLLIFVTVLLVAGIAIMHSVAEPLGWVAFVCIAGLISFIALMIDEQDMAGHK